MVSGRQASRRRHVSKSLKVVWFGCETAFGRLKKEELIFLMFLLNRVGDVKCYFKAVGLFVGLDRRKSICFL